MSEAGMKLPEGWEIVKLQEVSTKIGSGATPRGGKNAYKDKGIPLFRSLNVRDSYFKTKGLAFIDENQASKLANVIVEQGDVLLNITGASIARCCLAPDNFLPARVNQHVAIIRPISHLVEPKFLARLLISTKFKNRLLESGEKAGATRQALTKAQLQGFEIPLPPLPEQRRIVAVLDDCFAAIDKAIANTEQNLANARELFESHLNQIFTQKGEGWEEAKLSSLCSIKHGFAFKSQFFEKSGIYVLLTPGSFFETGGYRDQAAKTKYYTGDIPEGYVLEEGDFLFAMTEQAVGLLGSSLIVPKSKRYLHNQRLGLVQIYENVKWCNDFFFHQFNSRCFRSAVQETASGAKVRHTSPKKLGKIPVVFPKTKTEQEEIAKTINLLQNQTQRLEANYRRKLAALAELKQSLLQKAFAGELVTDMASKTLQQPKQPSRTTTAPVLQDSEITI